MDKPRIRQFIGLCKLSEFRIDQELLEEVLNKNLVSKVIEKPFSLHSLKTVFKEAIEECVRQKQEENRINGYKEIIHQLSFSSRVVIGMNRGLKAVFDKVQSIAPLP